MYDVKFQIRKQTFLKQYDLISCLKFQWGGVKGHVKAQVNIFSTLEKVHGEEFCYNPIKEKDGDTSM